MRIEVGQMQKRSSARGVRSSPRVRAAASFARLSRQSEPGIWGRVDLNAIETTRVPAAGGSHGRGAWNERWHQCPAIRRMCVQPRFGPIARLVLIEGAITARGINAVRPTADGGSETLVSSQCGNGR